MKAAPARHGWWRSSGHDSWRSHATTVSPGCRTASASRCDRRAPRRRPSASPARRPRPRGGSARAAPSSTRSAVRGSRLPVGSSARISGGRCTSARAIATRCSCPPDSVCGRRSSKPSRPTAASTSRRARRIGPALQQQRQRDVVGHAQMRQHVERLEHEAESLAPQVRLRGLVELRDVDVERCGRCRRRCRRAPAMQFSSVDLPTPDSPTTATNSPRSTCRSTSLKTTASP